MATEGVLKNIRNNQDKVKDECLGSCITSFISMEVIKASHLSHGPLALKHMVLLNSLDISLCPQFMNWRLISCLMCHFGVIVL